MGATALPRHGPTAPPPDPAAGGLAGSPDTTPVAGGQGVVGSPAWPPVPRVGGGKCLVLGFLLLNDP